MSRADQYDYEQGPVHPGGFTSVYSREMVFHQPGGAAPTVPWLAPQGGVPHRMPMQQRPPPAAGMANWSGYQPALSGSVR